MLDSYPEPVSIPEVDLLVGYSGLARMPHKPEKRPETVYYDESGLAYGEPISKGRTDRQRGKER
jgi:hypothetical protein